MMVAEYGKRRWSSFLLGAGVMLVAGGLWLSLSSPRPALAQVPDSGAQRNAMIKELRGINGKLGEVADLLREIRDEARKARGSQESKPKQPARP